MLVGRRYWFSKLAFGVTSTNTLSELPSCATKKPWVWMFVYWSSSFFVFRIRRSPGLARSTGGMKAPL